MDELEARARRQLDKLSDVNERLSGIRVSETSPDGEVTAEVDGNGALVDLTFSDRLSRLSGKQVSQLVIATANVACQKAFTERARILQEFTEEFAGLVAPPGTGHNHSAAEGAEG
ncbi:YbaB/EbfC family nucleoid-associated protein [Gordonia soli]|nr:YbaB/EbfC family nucleoid-associated protein [Gordonia soli]